MEASQRSKKSRAYSSGDIRFTTRENFLYAIALDWPKDGMIHVKSLNDKQQISTRGIKSVSLVGSEEKLKWTRDADGLHVSLPAEKPCEHAYTFKIHLKGKWVD